MMTGKFFFCIGMFLLTLCHSGNGLAAVQQEQEKCSYEKITQISLEDNGGYLLGLIRINGQPVHVVIDTGSEGSLISPQGTKLLRLETDPFHHTLVYGSKGGQRLVRNVLVPEMTLGHVRFEDLSFPEGDLPAYPRLDPPVVGLIGGDILSQFDLEFDTQSQKLVLWHVENHSILCNLPPFWEKRDEVPFQQTGYRILLDAQVDHHPVKALLDSGARSRILSLDKATEWGITPALLATRPGGIANGVGYRDTVYHWYRFHRFQLGNEVQENPVLTVSPLHDVADMLIGSDWFYAHKVWISYQREKLFFVPVK